MRMKGGRVRRRFYILMVKAKGGRGGGAGGGEGRGRGGGGQTGCEGVGLVKENVLDKENSSQTQSDDLKEEGEGMSGNFTAHRNHSNNSLLGLYRQSL